ncbi:Uncharacterised protein [Acholeplasma oculi]|uniref:hypothetical protein n=1 Tax=Acholeplasma oculi TaxID=35623 RepID=UPI0009C8723F|nr:hypothetical protein [Acholeplasma oculi]SKC49100.1 hypothetical protein SAMN02745122_1377 [Acholeplasma oculi]SUT92174.1 Uncharacterised protein [Acholeplasma oculi]
MKKEKLNKIKVKTSTSAYYKVESNHTIQKIVISMIQNEIESRLTINEKYKS